MSRALQALTIWQPWASAIVVGPKRIENRTWKPPTGLPGRFIAIHAGKRVDEPAAFTFCRERGFEPADLPRGAIVGVARLASVVEAPCDDPWFVGPIGWYFTDVVAIEPVPCNGAQGVWTVPEAIADEVRARYRARALVEATPQP